MYWRKAYHEPVALARQLREGDSLTRPDLALVAAHLAACIGHYHLTIAAIGRQTGYIPAAPLDFSATAVSAYGFSAPQIGGRKGREAFGTPPVTAWAEGAVVRCLVYLGDLGRYLAELCDAAPSLPARYYSLALRLKPGLGVPYSQLGTLCGGRNHGLDQLYHHLRAAACSQGAEVGQANLARLLEKSARRGGEGEGPGADMVASLLLLVAAVVGGKEQEEVTAACQTSLGHLHLLLSCQEQELEGPWLSLVVAAVVCLLHRLQGQEADYRVALCQAWLLALLSHLAQKVAHAVARKVWGLAWQEPTPHLKELEKELGLKPEETKKKRTKLNELLRRRRRSGSGSEGDDASEDDSETEEIFESDSDSELSDRSDLLDNSSDSEADVVIEDEELAAVPSEWELVAAVELVMF